MRKNVLSLPIVPRIMATIGFIFLNLTLIIIMNTPPASSYEISVYSAYPIYFWFFFIGATVCGIVILTSQVFVGLKNKLWFVGLLLIIFAKSVFLLLPEFRGYILYGWYDTLTHLGFTRDIIVAGHINKDDFYPIEHIIGSILILVVGFSLEKILYLFFVFFTTLYSLNMYIIVRTISRQDKLAILTFVFTIPFAYSFYHVNIHPFIFSLFMVPVLLYLYHKNEQDNSINTRALLVLFIFFITFFHPITALYTILVFLTIWLSYTLYMILPFDYYTICKNVQKNNKLIYLVLIILVVFFVWYFSYSIIRQDFKEVYLWLANQIYKEPSYKEKIDILTELGLTPLEAIEVFINRYGAIFLLLLSSMVTSIFVIVQLFKIKKHVNKIIANVIYATQFLVSLIIGIGMLFGYFIIYNPVRISAFSLLMGTILNGLVFYEFAKKYPRKLIFFLTTILIILATILSLGNVYNSPKVGKSNVQVTQTDIVGIKWMEDSTEGYYMRIISRKPEYVFRLLDYNLGVKSSAIVRLNISGYQSSHFGYDECRYLAKCFNIKDKEKIYVLIFESDKLAPMFYPFERLRQNSLQKLKEDFKKFVSDTTISRIYISRGLEIWKVKEYV